MAQSPISVDPQSRFIERYSFNDITDAFVEANSSFYFKQNVRIIAIIFQVATESYKDSLKIIRKFKGTEGIEFTEEILVIPTVRNMSVRFERGYSVGIYDQIYFECPSTASKNIILEASKWSLT